MYCLRTDASIGILDSLYLIPNIEVCKNSRFFEIIFNLFFIYIDFTFSFEDLTNETYQK